MWQARTSDIRNGRHYRLAAFGKPLSFRRFFELLAGDDVFAAWLTERLAAFESEAFYWELPPLARSQLESDAEFVLVEAPSLAGLRPDGRPFAQYFDRWPNEEVVTFDNLGGDAILVVPTPRAATEAYPHLAAFLRLGSNTQILAFWQATAKAFARRIGNEPVWLSTAGGGVAWLHVRLDNRPKYYNHQPYTVEPGT